MFHTCFTNSFSAGKSITLLVALVFALPSYSQFVDRNSLEFELEEGFRGQEIYTVGVNGFVISTKTEREQIRHFNEWKFHLFDTSFSQLYTKSQFISEHLLPYQQFANDTYSHNCFLSTNGDYLLNTFTIENFDLETVKGTFRMKGKVANMAISNQFAWFSYETKSGWFLISIDWFTGTQKVYPIAINDVKRKNFRIKKIQIFEEDSEIFLFVQANKNKMVSTSYVMKFNFEGEIDYYLPLDLHDDENIISISAIKQDSSDYVFTGTYSTEKVEKLTEGLFFIRLRDKRIATKKYFNYDDLNGFSEISSANYRYGYYAAVHDLIPTDSGFILLAEMYYPRYTLDINNVPVYVGNTYTHVTVCGFDTAGNKNWDETVELQVTGISTENEGLTRLIQKSESEIIFAYAEGNFYALQEIDLVQKKVNKPKFSRMDKNNSTQSNLWFNANIISWYDDCFLFFSTRDKRVKIGNKNRKIEAIFISRER